MTPPPHPIPAAGGHLRPGARCGGPGPDPDLCLLQVDIYGLVHDVVDLGQTLVRKPVKLINNVVAGSVPIIEGDPGRIVQILYNLFGNAGG